MSHHIRHGLFTALAASLISTAAGAQSLNVDTADAAALGQPLSITQRYIPEKGARAPLALLIDDSSTVAGAQTSGAQPTAMAPVVEEVGAQPAIAALAPGRLAITVSDERISVTPRAAKLSEQSGERRE